jgi:hypothetical protein
MEINISVLEWVYDLQYSINTQGREGIGVLGHHLRKEKHTLYSYMALQMKLIWF